MAIFYYLSLQNYFHLAYFTSRGLINKSKSKNLQAYESNIH